MYYCECFTYSVSSNFRLELIEPSAIFWSIEKSGVRGRVKRGEENLARLETASEPKKNADPQPF